MLLDVEGPAACSNGSPGQLSSGKVIPQAILVSDLPVNRRKLTAASAEGVCLVVALAKAGSSFR